MLWITTEDGQPITTEGGLILTTEGPAPPTGVLQSIIPSYPYQEYSDDINIVAFFEAFNSIAQSYLDWFNQNPLAVYTNANIAGPLLDWIMGGIYGIERPVFSSLTRSFRAGTASTTTGLLPTAGSKLYESGTATTANDDFYKRVGTWTLYAGNNRIFNVPLLRLRVARFLFGANGTDVTLTQAQAVNIIAGPYAVPPAPILSAQAGGSLPARVYGVQQTYVSPLGETLAGPASAISLPANEQLVVASPPGEFGISIYNTYVNLLTTNPTKFRAGLAFNPTADFATAGTNKRGVNPRTLQNASPIAIGTSWVEPTSGLVGGVGLPTMDTSNPKNSFVITIPAGIASQFFQQAFEQGVLPFPFQLSAKVVIA